MAIASRLQLWRTRWELARFRSVIDAIKSARMAELANANFVADLVRRAGLVSDRRNLYGRDNRYMNSGPFGLWQIPEQLGQCLVELSQYEIGSMIEIGTWCGWTITFMGAYLRRFNPGMRIVTVDTGNCWGFAGHLLIQMEVHTGTSADFYRQQFDLAFIDGDHNYHACAEDYRNVGRKASLCMFHDINDKFVASYLANEGGVPRLWAELKSTLELREKSVEFVDQSEGQPVMGIGLIVRSTANGLR